MSRQLMRSYIDLLNENKGQVAKRQPGNPYPENTRKGRSYDLGYYFGQTRVELWRAKLEAGDTTVQFELGHDRGSMDQDF